MISEDDCFWKHVKQAQICLRSTCYIFLWLPRWWWLTWISFWGIALDEIWVGGTSVEPMLVSQYRRVWWLCWAARDECLRLAAPVRLTNTRGVLPLQQEAACQQGLLSSLILSAFSGRQITAHAGKSGPCQGLIEEQETVPPVTLV